MTDIGHNNPPDPIDQINGNYEATRIEAENWLDGSPVETQGQMTAVDTLRKAAREWRMELVAGQKSEAAPLHDAWKAALARWKPNIEDAKRIETGLVATVDAFKRKLAAEKEAERRAAWEAAEKARVEAERAAAAASASDIEAQREAAEKAAEAQAAKEAASAKQKDTVKGMRTVKKYAIEDHRAALHWIAQNDRDAVTAFIEGYVEKNHKAKEIGGVKQWTEKEAF